MFSVNLFKKLCFWFGTWRCVVNIWKLVKMIVSEIFLYCESAFSVLSLPDGNLKIEPFSFLWIQVMSMKLAAVNPRLDFNIEALLSKDVRKIGIRTVWLCLMKVSETMLHEPVYGCGHVMCTPLAWIWWMGRTIHRVCCMHTLNGDY